jgi:hypothetical protein
MQEKLNNQGGKIEEQDKIIQGLKLELLKLQNRNEISDSQLEKILQGLANFQTNNENSGVQILSGSGGLIVAMVFLVIAGVVTVTAFYYRAEYVKHEKAANIMAERIVSQDNQEFTDSVFQAALHSDVEDKVLELIGKHQRRLIAMRMAAAAAESHARTTC